MSPRGQKQNEQMRGKAIEKITQAALEVFAEYGYHGATMKQIAQVTGLSYGLVYHYFPSKEKMFRQIIDSSLESSLNATVMLLGMPGSAWEKIENLSDFLVKEALTGDSFLYFLIVLQAMTQGKSIPGFLDHVAKKIEGYYDTLAPIIHQAQKSGDAVQGDPRVLAAAYFSFLQGLALLKVQGTGIENNVTSDILMSVLRNSEQTR
jgi:AcrR family transcriptional regulator